MDKLTFMKRAFLWTAIISAVVFTIVGILSPNLEGSVAGHIGKTVVMWMWVTVILLCLVYTLGQVAYDWSHGYKEKYGKGWFLAGIREDIQWIRENVTWKGVLKVIGTYLLFAAIFGVVILGLEAIFP